MPNTEHDLTIALTELAIAVMRERSLTADLERLAKLTTELIPVSSGATFALLIDGRPSTVAVTDHVALELDLAQYDNSEGPCIEALGGDIVRVAFLPADDRFPHFAAAAADQRVLSVLSTPVRHAGEIIGTLNLYSHQREAFAAADEAVTALIAATAASAIAKSEILTSTHSIRDRLQVEYDERMVVGEASRLLMAVQQCSRQQAEQLISAASADTRTTIIDTARRIIATGSNRD